VQRVVHRGGAEDKIAFEGGSKHRSPDRFEFQGAELAREGHRAQIRKENFTGEQGSECWYYRFRLRLVAEQPLEFGQTFGRVFVRFLSGDIPLRNARQRPEVVRVFWE
jgi:hypothetical protein